MHIINFIWMILLLYSIILRLTSHFSLRANQCPLRTAPVHCYDHIHPSQIHIQLTLVIRSIKKKITHFLMPTPFAGSMLIKTPQNTRWNDTAGDLVLKKRQSCWIFLHVNIESKRWSALQKFFTIPTRFSHTSRIFFMRTLRWRGNGIRSFLETITR